MADYKELLRRAVEALPENNGAARRAVYEKARSALVGQLRGINPPLPARDITTHRLQLEDCIRQVEQEASEANIAGMNEAPPPPKADAPALKAVPKAPEPKPVDTRPPVAVKGPNKPAPAAPTPQPEAKKSGTIEDIIAAAERDNRTPPPKVETKGPEIKPRPPKSAPVLVAKNNPPPAPPQPQREPEPPQRPAARQNGRPLPSIVARAEASKSKPSAPTFGTPIDGRGRGSMLEPRREGRANGLAARQVEPASYEEPQDIEAMSAVREVEVEAQQSADPQGAIDRAIATLDREARGDEQVPYDDDDAGDEPMQAPAPPARRNGHANGAMVNGVMRDEMPMARGRNNGRPSKPAREFATGASRRGGRSENVPRAMRETERGGFGAVAIFLTVFVVLLFGAGGAGIWAWQAGYLNVDAMFGSGTETPGTVTEATAPRTDATGVDNTETPATAVEATRVVGGDTPTPTSTSTQVTPLVETTAAEPRLDATSETTFTGPATDSAAAGSQSLLLEASDSGTTGAVAVSGDINWSKGTDENGQPTLIGRATIPARNLSVDLLIRKNSDPQLPASHLMEINFTVGSSFVGGSIAGLPGVLLKNEELVQGVPLVGASARVVGNQFLFALTTVAEDKAANINLLTSRKWMDLALIYASGKRAIITLEKDAAAQQLFTDVFAAWDQTAAN